MRRRSSAVRAPSVLRASASSLEDRSRSLTTPLRKSVVSAATHMYSCVLSVRWSMGCSAKGPTSFAVSPIATPAVIAIDSVAPGGPNRNAAQISAGNTAYLIGSWERAMQEPAAAMSVLAIGGEAATARTSGT